MRAIFTRTLRGDAPAGAYQVLRRARRVRASQDHIVASSRRAALNGQLDRARSARPRLTPALMGGLPLALPVATNPTLASDAIAWLVVLWQLTAIATGVWCALTYLGPVFARTFPRFTAWLDRAVWGDARV